VNDFRREQNRMGFALALLRRNDCLIRGALAVAAIFLTASASSAQVAPVAPTPEVAWTQELNKYPGLLEEFGRVAVKLQSNVQFPPPRRESHLLPLLPESTMSYAAFPNYGDAANQALKIFRQELRENQVLCDWWQRGKLSAAGPKIEDSLEKFYELSQYLGEELVVSGATEGRDTRLLIVAEVRKPGLKNLLQQLVNEFAGKSKPSVRVLDPQELAAAKDGGPAEEPVILVRPDYVVAALDLATLRKFNAQLDRGSRPFVATPFGQRVVRGYEGGVTVLAAADVHKILSLAPPGNKQSELSFQRSGFADMKYLVWGHTMVSGQEVSQAELSFVSPRHGAASWLAKPTLMGSLDFVSPKAMLAGTMVLANPAQIFDDVRELASASNPNAFVTLAQAEQALKLSVKEDLLRQLGGEITLELDSVTPPRPEWKTILKVIDQERLQKTLTTLLAATHLEGEQPVVDSGVAYHTVRIPSQQRPIEICYAFVDGYLVIGSSRETVGEGVRLHRSGESLGRSKKLLASLPPGYSPAASALFYQDPIAITQLNLQRFAPDMAGTLAKFGGGGTPSVVRLYGDDTSIREASRSGALDVGVVLVVAAVAIPNLLRSKIAANEATAVGSIRTVNTAEVVYATEYPKKGYARNLATLGPDPRRAATYTEDHANLLDENLGNESCTADAWCTKSGFHFRVTAVCKQHSCGEYLVVATPIATNTGTRSFCSTSDGVIHYKTSAPLTAPITASECRAWSPLQ
jgi:type IV pilus assembly protein PilA